MRHFLVVMLVVLIAAMTTFFVQAGITADSVSKQNSDGATAKIQVFVNDDLGDTLTKNVSVTLTATDGEELSITKRDSKGYYSVMVVPGTFTVQVDAQGYNSETKSVTISANQTKTVTVYLSPL